MILSNSDSYDFIVTGASGNVGRHLVPMLAERGYSILAIGRDYASIQRVYKDYKNVICTDYKCFFNQKSCDTLIHLAVRNNNQSGLAEDFIRDNVDFSRDILYHFLKVNGRRFVNLSSTHSLQEGANSFYSSSKDAVLRDLESHLGDRLDNVHIGYVHGPSYFGNKLRLLEGTGIFGKSAFSFFKLLKPSTSIKLVGNHIVSPSELPLPKILTDDISSSVTYRGLTRTLDLFVAILILGFLLPVFAVLWLMIRIDSPGPAIFAQTRVGRERTPFTLYKFRTMKRDTVVAGTHEVSVSAVTRVGGFLRRTKFDELPQAINLLRGDMTLVGPRPCLPVQKELIEARSTLGVYAMKPGITGYAQVRGIDMSRPQELATSDYVYMKLRSITLDLKIILLTASGGGAGDRVNVSGTL